LSSPIRRRSDGKRVIVWGFLVLWVGKRIYQDKQVGESRSLLRKVLIREAAGSRTQEGHRAGLFV
jgi:hypothetical protein